MSYIAILEIRISEGGSRTARQYNARLKWRRSQEM